MVNKCLLDGKLKERETVAVLNEIEDYRQFVKYFVKLIEDILNYDELCSYFEEDKTEVEIRIFEKRYELISSGMHNCYITACIKLHREDFGFPELKVAAEFFNYTMNIDHFIHGSVDDEEFVTDYLQIIKSQIFKDFKYDWSYNKDKIFKRFIKDTKYTPSEYIICCINNYIYDDIIKPKCKSITYDEFLNSEFKFDVDKKIQKKSDRYFFDNIPNI